MLTPTTPAPRHNLVGSVGAGWCVWTTAAVSVSILSPSAMAQAWQPLGVQSAQPMAGGVLRAMLPDGRVLDVPPGLWQFQDGQFFVLVQSAQPQLQAQSQSQSQALAPIAPGGQDNADNADTAGDAGDAWIAWTLGGLAVAGTTATVVAVLVYNSHLDTSLDPAPFRVDPSAPQFTNAPDTSVDEGYSGTIARFAASDPNGDAITYALGSAGGDEAWFTLDATSGALAFVASPNYEAPWDQGGDNHYSIEITASDPSGLASRVVRTVSVSDVAEDDTTPPPTITSVASVSVVEGAASALAITASSQDPGRQLRYGIDGGQDAARFAIGLTDGVLRFADGADFEASADANGDNIYQVRIRVDDGVGTPSTQDISVRVTDLAQETLAWVQAPTSAVVTEGTTRSTGLVFQATNGREDNDSAAITYRVSGGEDAGVMTIADNSTLAFTLDPNFETMTSVDGDKRFEVTVSAHDAAGLVINQQVEVTLQDYVLGFGAFGDGWSDNSSQRQRDGDLGRQPYQVFGDTKYNSWIDQLAEHFGVNQPVNAVTLAGRYDHSAPKTSSQSASNVAVGGAQVLAQTQSGTLADQVSIGTQLVGQLFSDIPDDGIFTLLMGLEDLAAAAKSAHQAAASGDDPADALAALNGSAGGYGALMTRITDGLVAGVNQAINASADTFIVGGVVDLSLTPFWDEHALTQYQGLDAAALSAAVRAGNQALEHALDALEAANQGVSIHYLDTNAVLDQILATPQAHGISRTHDDWWDAGRSGGDAVATYLWYDDLHPTSPVHTALANAAIDLLG